MDLGLNGRIAVITGGARGIGFATAQNLVSEGTCVALLDINADGITSAAQRLNEAGGGEAMAVTTDISDEKAVAAAISAVTDRWGAPEILVSSAAILDNKTFLASDASDWRRMLDVCLLGPMLVSHAMLPGMIEKGHGRIVCLASDAARVGQGHLSYYAAAKGGVIALMKSVAQEVGRHGITANVVSPGATNTELRIDRETEIRASMGEERYADYTRKVLRRYPTGRIGEPEDIAAMITFLVSDQASWVTGQVVSVNGGFVMP